MKPTLYQIYRTHTITCERHAAGRNVREIPEKELTGAERCYFCVQEEGAESDV